MKIEFDENKFGGDFTIYPETPAEFAQLLRLAKNANSSKPEIHVNFSTDNPYCSLWIKKRKESVQSNAISPKY